ncbi:MAG TPA: PQQ-binding-like beta-propeller repeat protein [Polyangia bacterium]|nr:PQQ-binding-like beta-propeller repeat protein [Polyangia bacterium]
MQARLIVLWAALGCTQMTARPARPGAPVALSDSPIAITIAWRVALNERPLLAWKPQEFARAASDGRRVFIGSQQGVFYALTVRDGSIVWSSRLSGGVDSQALYDDHTGLVFVGADDGVLYALDAASGRTRWSYHAKGTLDPPPVLQAGILYFATSDGRAYALEAQSGKWLWQYEREPPESFTIHGFAGVSVSGDRVYTGFADGYLVSLNAKNGEVVWARSLAAASDQFVDVDTTPVLADGTLYAASYSGGLYALAPKDGAVKWRFEVEGAAGIAVAGGRIYFTAAKTGLHVLDTKGRLLWQQALGAAGDLSPPRLHRGYILLSGSESGLYVVDRVAGDLLAFFNPGEGVSAAPIVAGDALYVLSNRGFFYKLALR